MYALLRLFKLVVLMLLVAIAYLLFWPVAIDPIAFTPSSIRDMPSARPLAEVELVVELDGVGPEDIAFDSMGWMYTGLEDGRVMRMRPDGSQPSVLTQFRGRPIGMTFDAEDNLVVCVIGEGFILVRPNGEQEVISDTFEGKPYGFPEEVSIGRDGTIYWSDGGVDRGLDDPRANIVYEFLEARGTGRVFKWDPLTREVTLLLDGIHFANGVTLSHDERSFLVSDLGRNRIIRHWIAGPQAGQTEVFLGDLPGGVDNISRGRSGLYWQPIYAPRVALLEDLAAYPFLRKMLVRIPRGLLGGGPPSGRSWVLGVDEEGEIRYAWHDADGTFPNVTTVVEHEGYLYLGNITTKSIYRLKVPS